MRVIDPGHDYLLNNLDVDPWGGKRDQQLLFVKREGPRYPGNVGAHEGTTMQEVLRAVIDRAEYVNAQIPNYYTEDAITLMRLALFRFEQRAAVIHGRKVDFNIEEAVNGTPCPTCGHVHCGGHD